MAPDEIEADERFIGWADPCECETIRTLNRSYGVGLKYEYLLTSGPRHHVYRDQQSLRTRRDIDYL
jgi:hypothetical protein